jgi:spermidine/putrescine-binding protein
MMSAKGAIKPVYEVMAQAGEKFDPEELCAGGGRLLLDAEGPDAVVPFNSSTTVFWYNKDASKGGLDPNQPPATWQAVIAAAAKLKASGAHCLSVHHRLAIVDSAREFLGVAQPAVRDRAERLRRQQSEARLQRPDPDAPHRQHAGLGEERVFRLRRAEERAGSEVLCR